MAVAALRDPRPHRSHRRGAAGRTTFVPAVGQGCVAVECAADDDATRRAAGRGRPRRHAASRRDRAGVPGHARLGLLAAGRRTRRRTARCARSWPIRRPAAASAVGRCSTTTRCAQAADWPRRCSASSPAATTLTDRPTRRDVDPAGSGRGDRRDHPAGRAGVGAGRAVRGAWCTHDRDAADRGGRSGDAGRRSTPRSAPLGADDWVVVASVHAARRVAVALAASPARVAAVGATTAAALPRVDLVPAGAERRRVWWRCSRRRRPRVVGWWWHRRWVANRRSSTD